MEAARVEGRLDQALVLDGQAAEENGDGVSLFRGKTPLRWQSIVHDGRRCNLRPPFKPATRLSAATVDIVGHIPSSSAVWVSRALERMASGCGVES